MEFHRFPNMGWPESAVKAEKRTLTALPGGIMWADRKDGDKAERSRNDPVIGLHILVDRPGCVLASEDVTCSTQMW